MSRGVNPHSANYLKLMDSCRLKKRNKNIYPKLLRRRSRLPTDLGFGVVNQPFSYIPPYRPCRPSSILVLPVPLLPLMYPVVRTMVALLIRWPKRSVCLIVSLNLILLKSSTFISLPQTIVSYSGCAEFISHVLSLICWFHSLYTSRFLKRNLTQTISITILET